MTTPEDGMKLFDDLQHGEKEVTPEMVRSTFVLIARSIALREESIRTLRELEATLANKVGTKVAIYNPRFGPGHTKKKAHCALCGSAFDDGYTHNVVEFDGRYWHRHNCLKKGG